MNEGCDHNKYYKPKLVNLYVFLMLQEIINGMMADNINPMPTIKVTTSKKPSPY
jgi:hypothetical protein